MMKRLMLAPALVAALALASPAVALADEPPLADPAAPSPPDAAPLAPAAAAPPVTAAAPSPPLTPADASPSRPVTVEVQATDGPATLERRAATTAIAIHPVADLALGGGAVWQPACVAPCVARLDPRYSYRVTGDGFVPTETFTLPAGADHARVRAKLGSGFGRIAGITMAGAGAVGMLAGGAALAASPVLASEDVGSQGFRTGVLVGGAGTLAVSALVVGAGIYLWATNGSRVEIGRDAPSASPRARVQLTPTGVAF